MEKPDIESTTTAIEEFKEWIKNFCETNTLPIYKFNSDVEDIINMPYDDIMALSSDECYCKSLVLMNYASLLQRKLDILNSQLQWCESLIVCLCSKYWNNYDKYLPSDIRRQSILAENSYGQELDEARIKIQAGITMLQETCKDLKKQVQIFQELGKKRSYS